MSFASTARKVTAFAAAAATLLALGACGNSNNGSAGNNGAKSTSEPQEGVPTNYTGSFPMPDPGKAYNNPKDRGELKQGGTLTLPITEIGPNWNAIDVNGNTVYMSGLWRFYMPCIWEYPADGSLENIKPNTNYVTKVEQTSDSPDDRSSSRSTTSLLERRHPDHLEGLRVHLEGPERQERQVHPGPHHWLRPDQERHQGRHRQAGRRDVREGLLPLPVPVQPAVPV